MDSHRILVGRFGAPHGVRGEVRLHSFTRDPKTIGSYGPLRSDDGRTFALVGLRPVKDNVLVAKVSGVSDRTAADALKNLDVYLDRAALPPPDQDEFYVCDLVGLDAVDQAGTVLGTIVDVPNYGGGDLIEIKPCEGQETVLFPFTAAAVPTIDFAARRVTIVPPDEVDGDLDGE